MQHLNGKMMCCIDTETTGLDPRFHEIWQICILPLTDEMKPSKKRLPFAIMIKPEHPEYIDWTVPVFKTNKKKIMMAMEKGFEREQAADMLEGWVDKLGLPMTKNGKGMNRCKIEPLGQNYGFDRGFIEQWLSVARYQDIFDYHYRDTMHAALYMNDRAAFHAEKVPFSKVNLGWICNQLGVVNHDAHDAVADCVATAECYRQMCLKGLF